MRNRMERLVLLPFTMGCVSESSVAIGVHHQFRSKKPDTKSPSPPIIIRSKEEDEESSSSAESMKSAFQVPAPLKPNASHGVHRLFRNFKTFSQLFAYKEDIDEELEMEIGVPTDVKHVTHIGWSSDGAETTTPVQAWDNLLTPHFLSDLRHPLSAVELESNNTTARVDAADHLIPTAFSAK